MKRYWKLITLVTFIVVMTGTLFIQAGFANRTYPEFVIDHKSGNQEEVKPLTIIGDYMVNEASYIRTEISDEGTLYRDNESSYLYLLKEDYLPPEIKRLQKEYRNFMRGKHEEQLHSFYEDQNLLAYVELKSEYLFTRDGEWSYSFEIDVLDQKSNERTKFEAAVPEAGNYNYLNIQGVQFINGELKITTVNEPSTNIEQSHSSEIHVYTVDLDTQKVVNDDLIDITTTVLETNQWLNMYIIHNYADIGPNKYFVFVVEKNEEAVLEDSYDHQTLGRQVIVYNLETKEQESIELPEEYEDEAYPELLNGHTIYFSKEKKNQIEIMTYNFEDQQIETKQTFEMPSNEGNIEEIYFRPFTLMNDKIYLVNQLYEGTAGSSITIGDVKTGEILYEGSIELAASSKDQQVNQMQINEINVRKE